MKSARHENIEAKEAEMHPTEFENLEFDRLESAGGGRVDGACCEDVGVG